MIKTLSIASAVLLVGAFASLIRAQEQKPKTDRSEVQQFADKEFTPKIAEPRYEHLTGPVVAIDEAHYNFHTLSGRYAAFAKSSLRMVIKSNL